MGGQQAPQPPTDVSGGKPLIDSNLKDNIKPGMETSPKDDFYLYVNYDWLLSTDISEGSRVVGANLAAEGNEHAAKAVSGDDLTDHDARQAQLLYRAAVNTAARDAAGVEPAKATIDDIRALSTVKAVYPEVWEDYAGLNLEGLSYYDARRAIWLFDIKRNAALTNGTVDERMWSDPTLIGSVAHYDGSTNSFHVAAGSVEPDVARYEEGEISLGELMGSPTGYCVFHEIGHALDSIDISIDKDGKVMEGSLLEPDDLKEFERRVQKAKDYYDAITAYAGQNVIGEVCVNEGLTEVCGMQARLAYAAKQDDFDYKAFFENRAKMARCLRTPELEQQCILGADKHPSAYVDVNAPAQMFEEFYETYDVQEGDGMYLAPDARIALW